MRMPPAKIKYVTSCSGSEVGYDAENLLQDSNGRTKWRGKAGVSHNTVVLQLDREHSITSIDIGNEYSALIEVLVAKSCDTKQIFHTLVPSTSFMDPMESRLEKNGNRVRMFSHYEMIPAVAKQKWDLVKLSCGQPFNQNIPFGIAFINIIVEESETREPPSSVPKIPLLLKKVQPTREVAMGAGEMFKRRQLFSLSQESNMSTKSDAPSETKEREKTDKRKKTPATAHCSRTPTPPQPEKKFQKKADKRKKSDEPDGTAKKVEHQSISRMKSPVQKRKSASPKPSTASSPRRGKFSSEDAVPFNKLLDGVRFSLSGYQNPQRSFVRDKALEMGAEYEAEWTPSCTHLVCAFPNTPKWHQAHSQGIIVTAKWIEMCHLRRKRIPENKFLCL